ncbi:SDR family NAD(P)-dependent oxidoreductase [Shewanella algae]|uniref:SDR family NAD(P)-dependent oxidoreductase n=1 Tax=Shewanella algae TaxID=38313 RepID=UPI00168A243E|nr:SDR family oxidoreductase [Shewanella algae]MBO2577392.1 SDR family oxidoreductase [Shewanella algae]MBO2682957.1 SDR family oxidoreductase [Shewanella algae]QNV04949.1 SDR family oxidoreductase [Shewanella algae]
MRKINNGQQWALVTGALGGIGKALTNEFVDAGYSVIATDIKSSNIKETNIYYLQLDLENFVLDENYAAEFYQNVSSITNGNGISCLINNAATQILADTGKITRRQWNASLNVNLSAPFFLSQLFLKDLEQNNGAIVNISSIHATQTKKQFVAYATTKAALSSMTRNMVLDVGNRIRINAIEPAAIATDMLKAGFSGKEEQYRRLEMFHPLGRVGTPSEVAKLAVFLSSKDAGFIQGACISASGGIQGCLSDPL